MPFGGQVGSWHRATSLTEYIIMTPNDFRQSLTATEPPAGLTHALAGLCGMRRAIGRGRTNPPRGTKALGDRGFTHTCTARKAIRTMQSIGMIGLGSQYAGSC